MRKIILITVLASTVGFSTAASDVYARRIEGRVLSGGDGRAGVFVTARDTTRGVAVSVVSDKNGRFSIECDAVHTVTARGIGFESVSLDIDASANVEGLVISIVRASQTIATAPASLIASALPESPEKRRLILDCMGCHQFSPEIILKDGRVIDEMAWVASVEKMIGFCGPKTQFPILPPDRLAEPTAAWIAKYLTLENLEKSLSKLKVSRKETTVRITEYDLPQPAALPMPDLPHDLMLDTDGHVLVTGMFSGMIYRLDPKTGDFGEYQIPTGFANPRALDIDKAGNWWVVLGVPMKIARYTLTTEKWDFFDIAMYPHSAMIDDQSRVWFNGHFTNDPELFGYLDPAADTTHVYEVPPPPNRTEEEGTTIPYGLRVGPDGTVWGTELTGNRLIRFHPQTGELNTYDMPSPHAGPRRLDIARDGTVWIPQYSANRLARFDPEKESFSEWEFPTENSLPYCARIDHKRGVVWISQPGADAIASFDMASERIVEYTLPTRVAFIRHLDIDQETGAVWGAYSHSPGYHPRIVRLEVGH